MLGLKQPPVLYVLRLASDPGLLKTALDLQQALSPHLPPAPRELEEALPNAFSDDGSGQQVLEILCHLAALIQEGAGIPIVSRPRLHEVPNLLQQTSWHRWQVFLPSFAPQATAQAFEWIVRVYGKALNQPGTGIADDVLKELDTLFDELGKWAPPGTNNRHFIREAYRLDIPFLHVLHDIYQFGWGAHARLFQRGTTDETGAIASLVSRDKLQTNTLLKAAGLPVAEQRHVKTLEDARRVADELGYPVVVKAIDMDQGQGVDADVANSDDLKRAFERIRRFRRPMVLERFVEGREYRLNVLDGRALTVTERVPAGVTGNGRSTLKELVDQENADPRRSRQRFSIMKPIVMDAEAQTLLTRQGWHEGSVIPDGVFVQLRKTANVSTGGTTFAIREGVHPDNTTIAERATQLLRLDFAGVDLILPDITKSWRETGGIICEVNNMPQVGLTFPEMFETVFDARVKNRGRIPISCVICEDEDLRRQLLQGARAAQEGMSLWGVANGSVYQDGILDSTHAGNFQASIALTMDVRVERALVFLEEDEVLSSGLFLDRFDHLLLFDTRSDPARLNRLLLLVEPHVRHSIIMPGDSSGLPLAKTIFGEARVESLKDGIGGMILPELAIFS